MRISDWSSDVCSSDLVCLHRYDVQPPGLIGDQEVIGAFAIEHEQRRAGQLSISAEQARSEEHTSELQSLMRISYAVFCLKKKITKTTHKLKNNQTRHQIQ